MKRGVVTFVVMFVVAVSGIATAGVLAGSSDDKADDKAEGNEQDAGVHGGPIERFHMAGSCDLTAVSSLPGNWTHGDYVSAVAANGYLNSDPRGRSQRLWQADGGGRSWGRAAGTRARAHGRRQDARRWRGRGRGFGDVRKLDHEIRVPALDRLLAVAGLNQHAAPIASVAKVMYRCFKTDSSPGTGPPP